MVNVKQRRSLALKQGNSNPEIASRNLKSQVIRRGDEIDKMNTSSKHTRPRGCNDTTIIDRLLHAHARAGQGHFRNHADQPRDFTEDHAALFVNTDGKPRKPQV